MKIDFSFLKGGKDTEAKGKLFKILKNPEFLKKGVFNYYLLSFLA